MPTSLWLVIIGLFIILCGTIVIGINETSIKPKIRNQLTGIGIVLVGAITAAIGFLIR